MLNRLLLNLMVFLSVFSSVAALPMRSESPIDFHADLIDFNNKSGIGSYEGHVRLQQNETIITAPSAKSFSDSEHKIAKAIALGNRTTKARIESYSQPKHEKMIATANRLTYFVKTRQVILEGDAVVIQGEHEIKAPKIIYDIIRDTVHFENGSYSGKGS